MKRLALVLSLLAIPCLVGAHSVVVGPKIKKKAKSSITQVLECPKAYLEEPADTACPCGATLARAMEVRFSESTTGEEKFAVHIWPVVTYLCPKGHAFEQEMPNQSLFYIEKRKEVFGVSAVYPGWWLKQRYTKLLKEKYDSKGGKDETATGYTDSTDSDR